MSWITDPHDLAKLPQLEYSDLDLDEPEDPDDKFWEEVNNLPDTVSYHQGIHVDICRFDEQGSHTVMSNNCPHYDAADELGPVVRQGWTVQQR
jgi:hypothetical protein